MIIGYCQMDGERIPSSGGGKEGGRHGIKVFFVYSFNTKKGKQSFSTFVLISKPPLKAFLLPALLLLYPPPPPKRRLKY